MSHSHYDQVDFGRAFAIGILLNTAFIGTEVAFGLLSDSLTLLADAGHNLSDVMGLLIAWGASEVRADFDACMQRLGPGANCSPSSPSLNDLSLWGGFATLGAFLTPFALGLILGVPVVAREIEGRTAGIAWTLSQRASGHLNRIRRLSLPLPTYIGEMIDEHRDVLDAVEFHDPAAAEEALRHHLKMVLASLPAIERAHPDYFEDEG